MRGRRVVRDEGVVRGEGVVRVRLGEGTCRGGCRWKGACCGEEGGKRIVRVCEVVSGW